MYTRTTITCNMHNRMHTRSIVYTTHPIAYTHICTQAHAHQHTHNSPWRMHWASGVKQRRCAFTQQPLRLDSIHTARSIHRTSSLHAPEHTTRQREPDNSTKHPDNDTVEVGAFILIHVCGSKYNIRERQESTSRQVNSPRLDGPKHMATHACQTFRQRTKQFIVSKREHTF